VNAPLGDEPSIWLTGDVKADALHDAIRAITIGEYYEVKAVRAIYVDLHRSRNLNSRSLLVLDAGFCIATPLQALQMHRREHHHLARRTSGYSLEDEAYIHDLLVEKLVVLADGRTANLGRLVNDYASLLTWEKEKTERMKLQLT